MGRLFHHRHGVDDAWRHGGRRRGMFGLVLIAGALGGLAFRPEVSSAQTAPTTVSASGWLTYDLPTGVNPALTAQQVVQGTRHGSVCSFTFDGSLPAGSAGIQEDEVAFNPSSCQSVYAVGPVPGAESGAGQAASSASGGAAAPASATAAAAAADPRVAFYLRTYYEDPLGIDVTSLRNDLEWTYTYGVCDTSYKWKRNATWYTPSGWELSSVGDRPSFSCGRAESNSHADMRNYPFCQDVTWNHYYYDHFVWGGYHGVAHYEWNDSKSGSCSGLLSHHYSVGWETPW